jgi:hypothetical protein
MTRVRTPPSLRATSPCGEDDDYYLSSPEREAARRAGGETAMHLGHHTP